MDTKPSNCCGGVEEHTVGEPTSGRDLFPMAPGGGDDCCSAPGAGEDRQTPDGEAPCCGSYISMESRPHDRPGYTLCSFVKGFLDTPAGPVPIAGTRMIRDDITGTIRVRLGFNRDGYRIAPGIYAVGSPDRGAPVLVSANYKLSFDALRKELAGVDAWILVLETFGVNVWCAAGKRSFSDEEVIHRVTSTGLEKIVDHRRLILPQLSATGVSAKTVKKGCGFRVIWGPIRAKNIRAFLSNGMTADPSMRRVTFDTGERLVLAPVEIVLLKKHALWAVLAIFVMSGIGPGIFSLGEAWSRGWMMAVACGVGVIAGTVAAPALLQWLPGKAFSVKGLTTGLAAGLITLFLFRRQIGGLDAFAMLLAVVTVSSFLSMNFTGSTPFTSPSGVEKEMRKAIPLQVAAVLVAAIAWVGAAFVA